MSSLRGLPRAGLVCALVAFANAATWSFVVPPFQVPDEIAHFAYAQYLAETGDLPPQGPGSPYSPQELTALEHLFVFSGVGDGEMRGVLTADEDRGLHEALASHPSPLGQGGVSSSTNQPPLYYALEAVPYWLSPSHDILTRLVFMRLLSALMAAGTVLAVFMFLRELLPGSRWAWTVGALLVAFQPSFDFIAAGVQGDNLLYLTAALAFLVLARCHRRGLTRRRAVALGATVAAGMLAKLTFLGLVPGIAIAWSLLAWRERARGRPRALGLSALAIATAAAPVAVYALLNVTFWHRGSPSAGALAGATASALPRGGVVTMGETLEYTWQLYLPRLGFMSHTFFAGYPLWHVWLNGSIGHFGLLRSTFPGWLYVLARGVLFALVGLALVTLVRLRTRIGPMTPLLVGYAAMAIGLLGAIGYAGVRYRLAHGEPFEQPRYLFPLLALYALFGVLAARGVRRKWAPALGAALVLLAMAHGLFAETLTIARYYG